VSNLDNQEENAYERGTNLVSTKFEDIVQTSAKVEEHK
jgi:hypothetical protein